MIFLFLQNNLIDETMPGLKESNEDVKLKRNLTKLKRLRDTVLPILSELVSVQISYEREIILNENSTDYVVALNEVLKHTIKATCTWVSQELNSRVYIYYVLVL